MPKDITERHFDAWARWYDALWSRYSRRTTAALVERVDIQPNHRVLDVGCGTGALEKQLLERNPSQRIVGVDLSEQMLRRARANASGSNVEYLRASAIELPFEAKSFDVVLSASAFHYFPEPEATLAEFRRVLMPDGQTAVLDWARHGTIMIVRDAILRVIDPAYVRCYTEDEAREHFLSAGWNVRHTWSFASGTYQLMILQARPMRASGSGSRSAA